MTCSSFHGRIDEIPGISVDNFERPAEVQARAYFLSHCHTDHTKGLNKPELLETLEKTGASIYMSEETAAVINDENPDKNIMRFIKTLKLGKNLITLPSTRDHDEIFLNVTVMPAGHSFGSVMFLFQTTTKVVLFTGDFRISSNDVPRYKHFHNNNGDPITIDTIYVDTTFIGYRYTNFPKRSVSIESAVEEIKKWLDKDDSNRVALHTSAKYGYEYVFNEIYQKLGLKVYVNEDRWKVYGTLLHTVPGVTNEENSSKIHICRNRTENYPHFNCLAQENNNSKYLFIHLSAMKWDNYEIDDRAVRRISEKRLDVCFPTHCSSSEVKFFIRYLAPKRTVGFPNVFSLDPDNRYVKDNCMETENDVSKEIVAKKKKLSSNEVIVDSKMDKELLKKIFDL